MSLFDEARAVSVSVLRQGFLHMYLKDLIERLASDARPIQRHAFRTMMWPCLLIGALCGLVVMVISIGLRPGVGEADTIAQLMVRSGFGLVFAIAGLAALVPSLRPDIGSALPKRILTTSLLLLFIVAAAQFPVLTSSWSVLYLGASIGYSPWMVVLLAIPSFVSLAVGVRFEAPTHLNVTGAALGLTSGGVGASLYAFGCSEGSASLGLAWLSVGIGLTTLGGMLIAPRLLRW